MIFSNAKFSPEPTQAEKYPTRQVTNIKKAQAEIKRRMREAKKQVLALVDSIPVKSLAVSQFVQNEITYIYELSATRFLEVEQEIRDIISEWLEVQNETQKPARWFFDPYTSKAYTDGTAVSAGNIAAQLGSVDADPFLLSQVQLENIMLSQPYRRRYELVSSRAFNDMVGFADENGARLGQILAQGVAGGQSPREISKLIEKEFESIEGYRAQRIARTEINAAYNTAREEMTQDARTRLGLDVRVMHVSALLEGRTRKDHAARHGSIYLPAEQKLWWSQGANKINCYCTTVEIVYIDGKPLQEDLIKKTRARGEQFLGIEKQWQDGIQPDKKGA